MTRSWLIAIIFAVAAAAWIGSGLLGGGSDANGETTAGPTTGAGADAQPPPQVRTREIVAEPMVDEITVQGRTIANRKVVVRAEVSGVIDAVPAARGATLERGGLIARIEVDDREARLEEARAELAAAQIEYDAAERLNTQGYRADTQLARARADLDAARAALRLAELRVANLEVRAPFGGILHERMVEVGDYVSDGDEIGMLVELDPLRVAGQISERHLGEIEIGTVGTVALVDGYAVDGTVSYVGAVADETTRTFTIEMEIANPDRRIIEGLTAELTLPVSNVIAHRVSPAVLHLADSGEIGVLEVLEDDTVAFRPVRIVGSAPDAVWLAGLPERLRIVTVGLGFIKPGQTVDPTPEGPIESAEGRS